MAKTRQRKDESSKAKPGLDGHVLKDGVVIGGDRLTIAKHLINLRRDLQLAHSQALARIDYLMARAEAKE